MKSIFAGASAAYRVYPEETLQFLRDNAGLDTSVLIDQDNWKEHLDLLKDADCIFTTWGMFSMTEDEIRSYMPNLKAIYYAAGSVQYFARPFLNLGVRVFSAWAANGVPVAEYTVAEIILANTGYFQGCRLYSGGQHEEAKEYYYPFPGNYGCKVGIIGAGQIGSRVIEMLNQNYHLEVLVYDPFLSDERAAKLGARKVSLEELFEQCQTISNHVANNPQTVGMLNYERCFSRMKDNATFLNTGRGAQVVEEDLVRALKEKPNATAVLDVTFPEPVQEGHPFYSLPNVFLTPHMAGSKGDELKRMSLYMKEEFMRVQAGDKPLYEVDLDMLEHMA